MLDKTLFIILFNFKTFTVVCCVVLKWSEGFEVEAVDKARQRKIKQNNFCH